jgi:hypothetical protein
MQTPTYWLPYILAGLGTYLALATWMVLCSIHNIRQARELRWRREYERRMAARN